MSNGSAPGSSGGMGLAGGPSVIGGANFQASLDSFGTKLDALVQALSNSGVGGGNKGYTSNYLNGATGNFGGLMRNMGNGGGASFSAVTKSVGSFGLGAFTGLGVRAATGLQSVGEIVNNTMQANQAMNSGVIWGAGYGQGFNSLGVGKAGFMGAQGANDYFTGQQMLQSLGGWTSKGQFQSMSANIGGTQLLNPMLSNAQVTNAVGGFAAMGQTNQLRMYGIQTFTKGKFTGSIQSIAQQLMQKMGIDGTHLTAQQIAEEGGSNSPLGQQLQIMVSNGSLTTDQAEMIREQILGNMQAQKSGSSISAFNANQAAAANGNKGAQAALTKLGYGKGALSAMQTVQAAGTKLDSGLASFLKDDTPKMVQAFKDLEDAAAGLTDVLAVSALVGAGGSGMLSKVFGKSALGGKLLKLAGVSGAIGGATSLLALSSGLGGGSASAATGTPSPVASGNYTTAGAAGALGAAAGGLQGKGIWFYHCLWEVFHYLGIPGGYYDAKDAWNACVKAGTAFPNDRNPPAGAICFWTGGSRGDGHVAISIGGGRVESPGGPRNWGAWGTYNISEIGGDLHYAGWVSAINGVQLVKRTSGSPTKTSGASFNNTGSGLGGDGPIASAVRTAAGVKSTSTAHHTTADGRSIYLTFYQNIDVGSGANADLAKTVGSTIATTSAQRIASLMGGK